MVDHIHYWSIDPNGGRQRTCVRKDCGIVEDLDLTVTGHIVTIGSMVSKTAAERKQAERERRNALGLQRFEFWLNPAEGSKVKAYVERLMKRRGPK